MTSIRTLSTEEVQARVARYSSLQPMSIAKDLEWVPQEAMDVVYARRGWTRDGVPTYARLKELGIDFPEVLEVVRPLLGDPA